MVKPRIFISSIMSSGFPALRDAARNAIESVGYEVVRAEDHPAALISARNACLDMVESSDAVVLILGPKYGNVTETGCSATEDEYRHAIRLKKPVYVFIQKDPEEPEARQAQFIKSIEGYLGEVWRKSFSTPVQLAALIEDALRKDAALKMPSNSEQVVVATNRISAALRQPPPKASDLVWLQIIWTPLLNEDVIKPTQIVKPELQKVVLTLAHEGDSPIFSMLEAKNPESNSTRLRIHQYERADHRSSADVVVLDLFKDGTLSLLMNVTGRHEQDRNAMMAGYYIDPDDVRARLEQGWSFAEKLWRYLDPYARYNVMLYNVALRQIGFHRFEKAPQGRHGSFGISGFTTPEELLVNDEPKRIVRADLLNPTPQIDETVEMFRLRFRELDRS